MKRYLFQLWLTLVCLSGGIALCFTFLAAKDGWKYFRLNVSAPAIVTKYRVKALSSSCYAIEAEYRYLIKEKEYLGKTVLRSPLFLNRFAAENQKKSFQKKSWTVWYRSAKPQVSSLEKRFPQKRCLHALLTLGIFAYFYFGRARLLTFY